MRSYNPEAQVIEADFEYAQEMRLPINESDQCVIHPMFYERLRIKRDRQVRVYPFSRPTLEDLELEDNWSCYLLPTENKEGNTQHSLLQKLPGSELGK